MSSRVFSALLTQDLDGSFVLVGELRGARVLQGTLRGERGRGLGEGERTREVHGGLHVADKVEEAAKKLPGDHVVAAGEVPACLARKEDRGAPGGLGRLWLAGWARWARGK